MSNFIDNLNRFRKALEDGEKITAIKALREMLEPMHRPVGGLGATKDVIDTIFTRLLPRDKGKYVCPDCERMTTKLQRAERLLQGAFQTQKRIEAERADLIDAVTNLADVTNRLVGG